jgi:hypothetical protein
MKTNLRQVYPSILTWALVIGSLLWSSGADEVVPTDHRMVFYPFRAVLYLILSSGLLSFVGAALIRKVQRDMDGKELSYPRAYYAFFLICFTSSVLFAFIMEGEHINGFRPRLFWWLLLLLSALVPLFYSGVIAPTGSIRARSYAFYSFFSVMFGCLSSFGMMILSDSYEGVKWLLGLIMFSVVVTAYGGQFLDFFKLKTLVRVRQRHKLLSSAKESVMPASIAQVIDTSSPIYREIMREVAPVVIGRLLATDSSMSPVELARKLITDAVLSRVEVGRGQDPMVIAHTVLIHEHDEIEKHAKRFAEAYAGGSIKSAISSVGDKNDEYGKKKSGPAERASVAIPPPSTTSNQATLQMPDTKEPVMSSTSDKVAVLNSMKNDEMNLYSEADPEFKTTLDTFVNFLQDPDPEIRIEARRLLIRWPVALKRLSEIYQIHGEHLAIRSIIDKRKASFVGRAFGSIYSEPLVSADVSMRHYGLPASFISCVCAHCGKLNKGLAAPIRGEVVPFYGQKENTGTTVVPVSCDSCGREFFVVWDQKL